MASKTDKTDTKLVDTQHVTQWNAVVECVGKDSLIMDHYPPERIVNDLIRRQREKINPDLPLMEIAAPKVYRDETGQIALPALNLRAALVHAGKFVPFDARKKLTGGDGATLLDGYLTIDESWITILNGEGKPATDEDWVIDVRKGNLKAGGKDTAVGITRPLFKKWGFTFTVSLTTEDGMSLDKFKYLITTAGKKAGLGSFRPNCGGPFGRFEIKTFEAEPAWVEQVEAA